jgi:hypothetical protein
MPGRFAAGWRAQPHGSLELLAGRCEVAPPGEQQAPPGVQTEGERAIGHQSLRGELCAFVPATDGQQAHCKGAGDSAAHTAFQAELAGPQVAFAGVLEGLPLAARHRQHMIEVDVGSHDALSVADLLGDPTGFPLQCSRPVQLAEVVHAHPQSAERVGFLGLGPDRAGDPDRLLAVSNGCLCLPGQVQCPGVTGEHAGALSRRWRPGQQPLRFLVSSQRAGLVAGDPAVIAQTGYKHGSPDRLVDRVHPADCFLNQLDGTPHRPG